MEMLKEMAIFAQVVDSGGFSAAARHLSLTTSAVSRHVSRLEAYMGGRLLQRTTRSVSLTELGEQVHTACVRMLNTAREIHALAGSYSARPNGVVRISAPVVLGQLWLAPLLPAFLDRYPEADVRLHLAPQLGDQPLRGLGEELRQREGRDALDERRADDGGEERDEHLRVTLADHVVDEELRRRRQHEPRHAVDGHEDHAERENPPARRDERLDVREERTQPLDLRRLRAFLPELAPRPFGVWKAAHRALYRGHADSSSVKAMPRAARPATNASKSFGSRPRSSGGWTPGAA